MKRDDLEIPEPCDVPWDHMTGDAQRRFCDQCTKHVHNLSELTRTEAEELLATRENLCVQYSFDTAGEVMFADNTSPTWRLHRQKNGLKNLLAAAALITPLALGACDSEEPPTPEATAPITVDADGVRLKPEEDAAAPGGGREPVFDKPTEQPEPQDTIKVVSGEPMPQPQDVEKHDESSKDTPVPSTIVGQLPSPTHQDEIQQLQGDVAFVPTHDTTKDEVVEEGSGEACDGGEETAGDKTSIADESPRIKKSKGKVRPTSHERDFAPFIE